MNEQQPQSNFEAMPGRKRMPLAQSLIFGRHSHYLPAILCLLYPVLAAIVHLPKVPLILAWLVIVLIWLTLRFGYQLLITRWIYQHNYVAAVRIGLFLMVVFPEDSYLLVNLANAFYGLGELEKADELADKAIFLGERLPLAYLIRTKVLVSIELQEESSEVYLI